MIDSPLLAIKKHLWCMPFSNAVRGSFFETPLTESGKKKENFTFLSVIKKCPQCGYQVEDPYAVRCPRCFKSLFIQSCCQGNCSSCGKNRKSRFRENAKTNVKQVDKFNILRAFVL